LIETSLASILPLSFGWLKQQAARSALSDLSSRRWKNASADLPTFSDARLRSSELGMKAKQEMVERIAVAVPCDF
jgi:hypothetical protein